MQCDFDLGRGLGNGVFSLTQFLLLGPYGFDAFSSLLSAPDGGGSSHMNLAFGGFISSHLKVEP